MSSPTHAFVVGACVVALLSACASGRVRGGQGTEMGQAEEYQPDKKVDPPTGNVDKTSGPLEPIDTYPVLEIDLERQVMFVVRDGASLTFNTSTGRSGWRPGTLSIMSSQSV